MGLSLGFLSCSISLFLFLCQYYTVLRTVALQYSLKLGRLIPPLSFFFLKIALALQYLLCFHTNCEVICSSFAKNTFGSLIGIALYLQIAFGSIVVSTMLIPPVQEHLHLFVTFLNSSISSLQIFAYRCFVYLNKFIPKYFIFLLLW